MQRAFVEVVVLGLACGPLGVWILLLRRAYAAESLSHAMLPGLVLAALVGVPLVFGAAAGYMVLWSVYWAFKLIAKKEGMGFGDFKLLAAIGAWTGWQVLPFVIVASAGVGAVVGGLVLFLSKKGADTRIPVPRSRPTMVMARAALRDIASTAVAVASVGTTAQLPTLRAWLLTRVSVSGANCVNGIRVAASVS